MFYQYLFDGGVGWSDRRLRNDASLDPDPLGVGKDPYSRQVDIYDDEFTKADLTRSSLRGYGSERAMVHRRQGSCYLSSVDA